MKRCYTNEYKAIFYRNLKTYFLRLESQLFYQYMSALSEPLRNSCIIWPLLVSNTLINVPYIEQ